MTTRKAIPIVDSILLPGDWPPERTRAYLDARTHLAAEAELLGLPPVIELTEETGAEFNATRTADEMTRYLVLDSERRWVSEWEEGEGE